MGKRKESHQGAERRDVAVQVKHRDKGEDSYEHELRVVPIVPGRYPVRDSIGEFGETIAREAVTDLVARANAGTLQTAVFLQHNTQTAPLATTQGKTAKFAAGADGSMIVDLLVDTRQQPSADAVISVMRGDIRGASIGFVVDPAGDHWNANETERTITRFADLPEFSLVTRPASTQTSVSVTREDSGRSRGRTRTTADLRAEVAEFDATRLGRDSLKRRIAKFPTIATTEQGRQYLELLHRRQRAQIANELAQIHYRQEVRARYSDADRKKMAKTGEAMPDGSYPVSSGPNGPDDLSKAVKMVDLGNAPKSAIIAHLKKRAKALNLTHLIPKAWQ